MLTTTKRLMRFIATYCVAKGFLVRAEHDDAAIATQLAKLIAGDAHIGDAFGRSVAISDGIAAIGATGDDDKGSTSGSVYVFEKSSDDNPWTQVAKLTANDGANFDNFGWSTAISHGNIVVGAHYNDDDGSNSGSAYIFEKSSAQDSSSWTQVVKLTPDDGAASNQFGYSVAISDGIVVVGAHYGDKNHGSNTGSAYIFEKSSSDDSNSWTQTAKLTADDAAASDFFGKSVAISGDTVVVGAVGDDDEGSHSGSAYVFKKSSSDNNSWTQMAKLTADDAAASDYFGFSVAISHGIVVVGAYGDDDNGSSSGSVYVFNKSSSDSNSWTQVAKLTADDGAAEDYFGRPVAICDDTIVVGAYKNNNKNGSVYIFKKGSSTNNSWKQVAKLTADDGEQNDEFGRSVAINDGTIVIGVMGDEPPGTYAGNNLGSAYVFEVAEEESYTYSGTYDDKTFTTTVAKTGDNTYDTTTTWSESAQLGANLSITMYSEMLPLGAVLFIALVALVAVRTRRVTRTNLNCEDENPLSAIKYGAVNA